MIPVFEAYVLACVHVVFDLERRRFGAVEYPKLRCSHFDFPGRQLRIGHSLGAKARLSLDRYDVLAPYAPRRVRAPSSLICGSKTTWVIPSRSLRSTNISPHGRAASGPTPSARLPGRRLQPSGCCSPPSFAIRQADRAQPAFPEYL